MSANDAGGFQIVEVALGYARLGLYVFPCYEINGNECACAKEQCKDAGKHPRTARGFLDATIDRATITEWWRRWPNANIGIACQASGVVVLDADLKYGGPESLRKLQERLGTYNTARARTGGGGTHDVFIAPKSSAIRSRRNAFGDEFPGLDIKANGGYFIAAPSLHASGIRYVWDIPPTPFDLTELPPTWLEAIAAADRAGTHKPIPGVDLGSASRIPEGQRHDALTRWAGRLRRLGTAPEEIDDTLRAVNARRCDPPYVGAELEDELRGIREAAANWPIVENLLDSQSADDVIAAAAKLPHVDYDRARKEIAKKLVVRVETLDRLVDRLRDKANDSKGQGSALTFEEIEQYPEPVDGSALLTDIADLFARHVVLPKGAAEVLALWCVFTHVIDAFSVAPILALISPTKQCGKTRTLGMCAKLVARPLAASNISHAATFRAIEQWKPTLLIDEFDSFLKRNDELRGILNAGHTRDAAFVVRTVGDDYKPRRFSTWGAKLLAGIGTLPATLADRSIALLLQRRAREEGFVRRLPLDEIYGSLRSRIARWVNDHHKELVAAELAARDELELRGGIINRLGDNWAPFVAIATVAGREWTTRVWAAANALSGTGGEESQEASVQLLRDVRVIFGQRGCDRIHTDDLLAGLWSLAESPWVIWSKGKSLNARSLAKLLRGYKIGSSQLRIGDVNRNGYTRADFEDAFSRYLTVLPLQNSTWSTSPSGQDFLSESYPLRSSRGSGLKTSVDPCGVGAVDHVEPQTLKARNEGQSGSTPRPNDQKIAGSGSYRLGDFAVCPSYVGPYDGRCARCTASWAEHQTRGAR